MSELAKKLIAEEKEKQTGFLNIGNCGLRNLEKEVPELFELTHLNELILGDTWWEYYQLEWVVCRSENNGKKNQLEFLPAKLLTFKNLRGLIISNNFISKIENIPPNLKTLVISDNKIKKIENLHDNLKHLDISNNEIFKLEKLPTGLGHLNISGNKIQDLRPLKPIIKSGVPTFWGKRLYKGIWTYGNPLETPPPEIIKQGNRLAILSYFQEIEKKESDKIYEAKVLILGDGGAGKTSLFRKLQNPENPLPKENETTKGIDIHELYFDLDNGRQFRMNVWGFGGQEIYHATHQFFLNKRSLYVLLDDTRTNDKAVNDPSFRYWLPIVELLGGESPLLIVQNEKGDRSKQLDLKSMRGRYDFIAEVLPTNLASGRGLAEVRAAIERLIQSLPHIGSLLPKSWIEIRKEIEILSKQKHVISREKWRELCEKHGISERRRCSSLSEYFHDIGVFLHFQEDALLRKSVILQKDWATAAVYRALDNEGIKKAFGQFDKKDLEALWKDEQLEEYREELLALMEKFELCYQLPNRARKKWLAPQLLNVQQPDYQWNAKGSRELRFEYEFLPRGLVSRLIVRLHRFVVRTDLAWRSGVLLERLGAQAEVMELAGDVIRIRVIGEDRALRKELLTIISDEFEKLHSTFIGLRVEKQIACHCEKCQNLESPYAFDFDYLLELKREGIHEERCRKSKKMIPIQTLLDEIERFQEKAERANSLQSTLRDWVANNKLKETIRELKKLLPETKQHLILDLENQWKRLNEDEIKGKGSFQETGLVRNKITLGLLELISELA